MRRTPPVLSLLLAFALFASSLTMAVARGQMAATSELVICSGYGVVTLTLDARGNPVQSVHPCPDCLAAHVSALIPDGVGVVPPSTSWRLAVLALAATPRGQAPPHATARGPPRTV